MTRLLKKLTNAQEKAASEAPSASTPASTSASTTIDSGFGFNFSLGSVLLPGSTPHLASPAPYLAPISPHLGEAALPGEGKYRGGGDDQPPNEDVLAQSCGQTAGAWSGGGGVGLTDTTPRLKDPLPGFLSSHAVSFT